MSLRFKMLIIVNCFFTHSYRHVNKINIYLWALIHLWVWFFPKTKGWFVLSASLCYGQTSFKPVLSQGFPVCQGCLTSSKSGLTLKDVGSEPLNRWLCLEKQDFPVSGEVTGPSRSSFVWSSGQDPGTIASHRRQENVSDLKAQSVWAVVEGCSPAEGLLGSWKAEWIASAWVGFWVTT